MSTAGRRRKTDHGAFHAPKVYGAMAARGHAAMEPLHTTGDQIFRVGRTPETRRESGLQRGLGGFENWWRRRQPHRYGIPVNTVNPSAVETRMMRSLEEGFMPGNAQQVHDNVAASIPLKRYAEPGDIAKVMLFLASDDAEFVTGSVYMADGGSTAG